MLSRTKISSFFSFIAFFISKWYLGSLEQSLVLIDHKYPPNIYYLSYGLGWISLLYLIHKYLFLEKTFIQKPFDFLSRYSYEFFFIHYYFLFLLLHKTDIERFGWIGVTVMILILTAVTITAWEKIKIIFSRR